MAEGRGRRGRVVAVLVLGLALVFAGAALWFAAVRLDVADQWGSVVGGIAAVLGVPMTAYRLGLGRRGGPAGGGPAESSVVDQQIRAGRDAYVAGRDQHF